jgi:signal transduction histidine kinase
VLGRVPGTTPLIAQGIDAIERNSRLQTHLIADLLDFAAIQFGKVRFDLGVIDPVASIEAALDMVAPQSLAKGV